MADRLVTFTLLDGSGAPLTNATPTFVDYRSVAGAAQAQPTISNLGGGQYGFTVSSGAEQLGIVFLVDCGGSASPQRVGGAVSRPTTPIVGFFLEDAAGDLYTGLSNPTFATYQYGSGTDITPQPTLVPVSGRYLWAFVPDLDDLAEGDIAYSITAPAGAYGAPNGTVAKPLLFAGTTPRNPANDLAAVIAAASPFDGVTLTKETTLGTRANLFLGPVRVVNSFTPALAVFCLNVPGPAPVPYIGNSSDSYAPQVEVTVRSAPGKFDEGDALARNCLYAVQRQHAPGYFGQLVQQSLPEYLGEDEQRHHQWRFTVELWWKS